MMKRSLGNLILLFMSLMMSVGLAEVALRHTLPAPPTYEDIIRNLVDHPERLFKANTSVLYDIKGLYEGAETVELNVSKDRLIEPKPQGVHKYRVLFLGGSTTEAIYVPQPQRWVALLDEPGFLAAYNAGQSGANTIDEYFTFKYLTAQGMKFDLVVLTTGINDMPWLEHFERHGNRFIVEEYKKGVHDYYAEEMVSKQISFDAPAVRSAVYLLASEAFETARQSLNMKSTRVSPKNVTQIYLDMRRVALTTFTDDRRPPDMRLTERYDHLEGLTQKYREIAAHNISLLKQAVVSTGAKLLVITEATSWMAPTSSFYQDLRIPGGMSSYEDLHEYRLLLNGIYLEAAKQAGALTYDLAADVNPDSNGPQGGRYMYDSMHYSPEGCALAASFMRGVLRQLLEFEKPK